MMGDDQDHIVARIVARILMAASAASVVFIVWSFVFWTL